MIRFSQLVESDLPELLEFSATWFGGGQYQALPEYVRWLYPNNAFSNEASCLIAKEDGGGIVGCIHIMRLEAWNGVQSFKINSLQNLMMAENYRGGAGLLLLRKALKNADISIAPGVAGDLATAYSELGYQKVMSFWGRKILQPVSVAKTLLNNKIFKMRYQIDVPTKMLRRETALEIGIYPDDDICNQLAERLQARDLRRGECSLCWTGSRVKWRFFEENGPRHVLICNKENTEFCIASIGMRHGFCIGRPIEWVEEGHSKFLSAAITALANIGVQICLGYSTHPMDIEALRASGFKAIKNSPSTFTINKNGVSDAILITSGATDIGFESFSTRFV